MIGVLQKLGLSEKEIAVYTALLTLGSASVRQIAEASKINRGTTYDILHVLMNEGLVSYLNKETKHHFTAEDPTHLRELVHKQQTKLREVETDLEKQIPELQSLHKRGGEKPVVRYFEGKRGVRTLLTSVLTTMEKQEDKQYYVYSSSTIREHYSAAYPHYTEDRIKRNIFVKAIAVGPGGVTHGLDERKWLTEKEGSPTYTIIYAGNMAHIALNSVGQMVGVIIENEAVYRTQQMLFEALWERLS